MTKNDLKRMGFYESKTDNGIWHHNYLMWGLAKIEIKRLPISTGHLFQAIFASGCFQGQLQIKEDIKRRLAELTEKLNQ